MAARAGFGSVRNDPDLVTPKLPALQFYQLALEAPRPAAGYSNAQLARSGRDIFHGRARCSSCHVPPLFTEPGWNMHTAEEIGIDDFQAQRSPDVHYRTTPLKGLCKRLNGGFYHDGRFKMYEAVVAHYDRTFGLALSVSDRVASIEYLKCCNSTAPRRDFQRRRRGMSQSTPRRLGFAGAIGDLSFILRRGWGNALAAT